MLALAAVRDVASYVSTVDCLACCGAQLVELIQIMPQGFTAVLEQSMQAVRIWAKHPKIAQ